MRKRNIVSRDFGASILATLIRISHQDAGGRPVVIIKCEKSTDAVYLGENVWVRVKAGNRKLSPKEAAEWTMKKR